MLHARPHLETHVRNKGHSSVAGAAYRLGLKLYDRKQKKMFDFRVRTINDQVVFQTTLAPPGAPLWATDPLELWNRVEMAERRKDSQVARDYRLPLPLGLSDSDICAMAIDIARYISTKLVTPVSIAVHRDSPVTAHGAPKAAGQIGCHAHLYFPTRKVLLDEAAAQDGKEGGSGMGEKHEFLRISATSGFFLEELNKTWAEAANRYAAAAGITADYDHRSYRRQGLKIRPQPHIGAAATALERKGIRTKRGANAREVAVLSEVYRAVHAHLGPRVGGAAPATQGFFSQAAVGGLTILLPDLSTRQTGTRHAAHVGVTETSQVQPPASLFERFRAVYAAGMEEGDRPEATLVFRLVRLIERTLNRFKRAASQLDDLNIETRRAQTEKLDADADLADWVREARREEASPQAPTWQRAAQVFGKWVVGDARPTQGEAPPRIDPTEAGLRERVATRAKKVADFLEQAKPVRNEVKQERRQFRSALREFQQTHDDALPQLLAVCWEEERAWIERYMPELLGPIEEVDTVQGGQGGVQRAVLTPFAPRPRL